MKDMATIAKTIDAMNDARIRQRLHEILDLVLDVNGLGARKKEITGALPTAFFYFSGHIGSFDVSVYPEGWEKDSAGINFFHVEPKELDETIKFGRHRKIVNYLKSLRDGDIDERICASGG